MTEEGRFSTKDLMAVTDLSYRNVTDWDAKGIIPGRRDGSKGWRRFTVEEVFVTLLLTEIRKQFGISITNLRWLKDRMFEDKHGHLPFILGLMQGFGSPVFLLADFHDQFRICSVVEMMDAVITGYFDDVESEGFVLYKINPLVNRLLTSLGVPAIEESGLGYDIIFSMLGKRADQTPKERELLETIRNSATTKVEVTLKNGTIVQSTAERKLENLDPKELLAILNSGDHQTLSVTKHDGKITSVRQKIPGKPDKKYKRGSSGRRK